MSAASTLHPKAVNIDDRVPATSHFAGHARMEPPRMSLNPPSLQRTVSVAGVEPSVEQSSVEVTVKKEPEEPAAAGDGYESDSTEPMACDAEEERELEGLREPLPSAQAEDHNRALVARQSAQRGKFAAFRRLYDAHSNAQPCVDAEGRPCLRQVVKASTLSLEEIQFALHSAGCHVMRFESKAEALSLLREQPPPPEGQELELVALVPARAARRNGLIVPTHAVYHARLISLADQ